MRFKESLVPIYALAVLTAPSVRGIVVKRSRQAAQQNFSGPGLCELPMPIPPHRVAARIRPSNWCGGKAEDGAVRVAGGAGRALRLAAASCLSRSSLVSHFPRFRHSGARRNPGCLSFIHFSQWRRSDDGSANLRVLRCKRSDRLDPGLRRGHEASNRNDVEMKWEMKLMRQRARYS